LKKNELKNTKISKIKRMVVSRQIGSGAFGTVDAVYDRDTQSHFARKKMSIDISLQETGSPRSRQAAGLGEVAIMRGLSHPNLMPASDISFDVSENCVAATISMPLGLGDLKSFKNLTSFPIETRVEMIHQLFLGMAELERHRICHMDLKPENIILFRNLDYPCGYQLRITDFSISVIGESIGKIFDRTFGTVNYRPPESLANLSIPVNSSFDVWSAGAVAFLILTGKTWCPEKIVSPGADLVVLSHYRKNPAVKIVAKVCTPLRISKELQDLIISMLDMDPKNRPSFQTIIDHSAFDSFRNLPCFMSKFSMTLPIIDIDSFISKPIPDDIWRVSTHRFKSLIEHLRNHVPAEDDFAFQISEVSVSRAFQYFSQFRHRISFDTTVTNVFLLLVACLWVSVNIDEVGAFPVRLLVSYVTVICPKISSTLIMAYINRLLQVSEGCLLSIV